MDTVRWRLKDFLNEHNLTTYALVRASKLAPNTVYSLARGSTHHVRLDTIAGVLGGLRKLTGDEVGLTDILEHEVHPELEVDDQDLLLASGTADLQAALDDLESHLLTGEVDAWLEAFYAAASENADAR